MKRTALIFTLIGLIFFATACATTKRDCRGNKKYKHPNGFYMEP